MDEAVPLLVAQDKNPAFHKVVSGLKAVHPPRNPMGLRVQPANLTKPKQEAAPVQQVSSPPPFPTLLPRACPNAPQSVCYIVSANGGSVLMFNTQNPTQKQQKNSLDMIYVSKTD